MQHHASARSIHWGAAGFYVLCGLSVLVILLAGDLWDHYRLLYPKPTDRSVFLAEYNADDVLDMFLRGVTFSHGDSQDAAAGKTFLREKASFSYSCPLATTQHLALMSRMNENFIGKLNAGGAHLLDQSGDAGSSFRYRYIIDKSIGSASIELTTRKGKVRSNIPLPSGVDDVALEIHITENCYRKGIPTGVNEISDSRYVPR